MTNLYIVTRFITFFGTSLRVFWEHVACRICKVPIEDIRAFKTNEMCGHIEHELPDNLKHSFLICWLPFTMNFLIGCSLLLTGSYRLFYIYETDYVPTYVLVWLGFSCIANCASSFEDALNFRDYLISSKNNFMKVVLYPFFGVNYVMASVERYSVTTLISLAFTVLFPQIFNLLFPMLDFLDQQIH